LIGFIFPLSFPLLCGFIYLLCGDLAALCQSSVSFTGPPPSPFFLLSLFLPILSFFSRGRFLRFDFFSFPSFFTELSPQGGWPFLLQTPCSAFLSPQLFPYSSTSSHYGRFTFSTCSFHSFIFGYGIVNLFSFVLMVFPRALYFFSTFPPWP